MDMLSPFSFPFLVIIRGQDPERDLCKIMLIKQRDPADRDRIPGRKGMAPYQRWKLAMNLEGLHCRCHGVRQKQGISALGCWLPRHRVEEAFFLVYVSCHVRRAVRSWSTTLRAVF
jgi:hypothetical protein